MHDIVIQYKKKKKEIKKRLKNFKNNKNIFAELCFCLLTPQSKAVNCDKAIKQLRKKNILIYGSKKSVAKILKKLVRFHNNKASYIVAARKSFKDFEKFKTREWLVQNIKGLGHKEASHFLRNIGLGEDVAIIDRHVIRNLKKEKIVKKIPETITKKNYLEIENKMRKFARKKQIPLAALDLLFWSNETGFIFK